MLPLLGEDDWYDLCSCQAFPEDICSLFLLVVSCPSGWTESTRSGTCIKLYEEDKSWEEARAACKADGADLVKIIDEGMNQFIWGKKTTV